MEILNIGIDPSQILNNALGGLLAVLVLKVLQAKPRKYLRENPNTKSWIDYWMHFYYYYISRVFFLYAAIPFMICISLFDSSFDTMPRSYTVLICCGLGVAVGLLYDWGEKGTVRPKRP